MAKWLFISFIALMTFAMNAAAIDQEQAISLFYSLAAVNTFAGGLLLIWLGAYFVRFEDLGARVIGHALVFLAAGVAFIGIGHFGLAQKTCLFPDSQLSKWAFENGACRVLSVLSIGFGVFVLWPSVKLLRGRPLRVASF